MADKPNPQPLAALLASHPEECAAVVAVLTSDNDPCQGKPTDEVAKDVTHYEPGAGATTESAQGILDALCAAGLAEMDASGDYAIECHRRYAIARMGAAAWLAARVTPCG